VSSEYKLVVGDNTIFILGFTLTTLYLDMLGSTRHTNKRTLERGLGGLVDRTGTGE